MFVPYDLSQICDPHDREVANSLNGLARRFESVAEVRAYAEGRKPKLTCYPNGLVVAHIDTKNLLAALGAIGEVFVGRTRPTDQGEGRDPAKECLVVVIDLHSIEIDIRHEIEMLPEGPDLTTEILALSSISDGPCPYGIDSAAWTPSNVGYYCIPWEHNGYQFAFRRQPVVVPPKCTPSELIANLHRFMADNDLLPKEVGEVSRDLLLYDRLKDRPDFPAVMAKLGQPNW